MACDSHVDRCCDLTGALCNGRVRCPWHGACFSTQTGDIEDFPGLDSIPKFDVSERQWHYCMFS